jgi:anti-sigma factor RsiW
MNCRRTQAHFSEYVDSRLPLGRQRAVERHLEHCPTCREQVEELRALKSLLAQARRPVAPEGFWDSIYAGLRQQPWQPRSGLVPAWSHWLWRRAPALTGGVAVLLLLAAAPLQYLETTAPPAVALDQLLSRHAGVCAKMPLGDRNRMHFIDAEARAEALP